MKGFWQAMAMIIMAYTIRYPFYVLIGVALLGISLGLLISYLI